MNRRGQSLIEATLVLLVFVAMLLGIMDVAQVVYTHQSLVTRANTAVRWAVTHPWQGPEAVRNFVLYNQPAESDRETFLGLKPENVVVEHRIATAEHPDDEMLVVAVVNYESHTFSPWLAQRWISARPVLISTPVKFQAPQQLNEP